MDNTTNSGQVPTTNDDRAKQLREQVQNQIVSLITGKLEQGEMSESRAKDIAALVLEKLPEDISYDKLMEIIPKLDDHFEELTSVVVPIMTEYEHKVRAAVNDKITKLIASGKLDEALNVAKKAIEFEKGLA